MTIMAKKVSRMVLPMFALLAVSCFADKSKEDISAFGFRFRKTEDGHLQYERSDTQNRSSWIMPIL